MKKRNVLPVVILVSLGFSAYTIGGDIISRLGMTHKNAQDDIFLNFNNSFYLPRLKALPEIVSGDKVGAAKELCAYIKMYCNSQEFADAYAQKRNSAKPDSEPPQMDPAMIAEFKNSIPEQEAAIAEYRKMNGYEAQAEELQKSVDGTKALILEWEDPTPNKTKWEKNFPLDPAVLVKQRLEEYLQLVATVDFNAKLTASDRSHIQKFVDAKYEAKSPQWKASYRAGKEVNDAVSAFVKEWLKGDIVATVKTKIPVDVAVASSDNSREANSNPAISQTTDSLGQSTKAKKSLLGKMKDKAKSVISN